MAAGGIAPFFWKGADVGAGGEGLGTRASDDDTAHVVVADGCKHGGERIPSIEVQRVALRRSVQRDGGDVSVTRQEDFVYHLTSVIEQVHQ